MFGTSDEFLVKDYTDRIVIIIVIGENKQISELLLAVKSMKDWRIA
jgi:hypothetical protein